MKVKTKKLLLWWFYFIFVTPSVFWILVKEFTNVFFDLGGLFLGLLFLIPCIIIFILQIKQKIEETKEEIKKLFGIK